MTRTEKRNTRNSLHRIYKVRKHALYTINHALTRIWNFEFQDENIAPICIEIITKLLDFDRQNTIKINQKYGHNFKLAHLPKRRTLAELFQSTIFTAKLSTNSDYEIMIDTTLLIASFMMRYDLGVNDWSIRAQHKFWKLQSFQRDFDPKESLSDAFFSDYYPYSIEDAYHTVDKLLGGCLPYC